MPKNSELLIEYMTKVNATVVTFAKNSLGTLGTFSHVLKNLLSRGYYLSPIFLLPFTATHKKAANRFSGLPLYRFI